jgi:hypothetical protein
MSGFSIDDIVSDALTPPEPEAAAEAPAEEVVETAAEPEVDPAPESELAVGEDGEPVEPAAEPEPVLASDDALIETEEGEKISVAELREREKANGLRQAAFTQKTQKLADERREFEAERAEVTAFIQQMKDPDMLEAQCLELFPDAFEQAVERRAKELLILTAKDTSEAERSLVQRERALRVRTSAAAARGGRDEAVSAVDRRRQEEETNAQKVATLRQNFNAWGTEAAKAVGLDMANKEHRELVIGKLKGSIPNGVEITAEHFKAAAKSVATLLKVKPAQPMRAVPPKRTAAPPATGSGGAASGRSAPVAGKRKPAGAISTTSFLDKIMGG